MPKYTYTARDRSGQTVSSTLDAPSRKDALRQLAARGLQPQSINDESGAGATAATAKKNSSKPSGAAASQSKTTAERQRQPAGRKAKTADAKAKLARSDQLPFLEALADLIASGLSAGESMRMLSHRMRDPKLQALCAGLWELIGEGATLSRAMSAFPQVFEGSTVNLIQAGEATGGLGEVLNRLITHLSEQRDLRRQFANAIAYPLFLLGVAFCVVLFSIFFLIPRMQSLFNSLGGKLPFATQLLVYGSEFLLRYGLFLMVAAAFGFVAFWRWRKSAGGRRKTDDWLTKLPLSKEFSANQTILAFGQTLSVLLENGITTADALKITERQITNTVHREAFNEASSRVREGETLSIALQRTECFPPLVLDQLAIGENTGSLVPSLKKIATSYRRIVSAQLNFFMKIITSAVMGGTFGFIIFLVFAIVTAIFKLSSSFRM